MTPSAYITSAGLVLATIILVFRVVVRRVYGDTGRLTASASAAQYVAILAWVVFGSLNVSPGWPRVHVGWGQEAFGWFLFIGGWAVFLWSLVRLGIRRSHGLRVSGLRQSGLYSLSRNPQSAAFLVAMIGYVTLWPTWRNAGVLFLVTVLTHLMIRTEEEHLSAVFGPEYRRYLERVPRYFGRSRQLMDTSD